MVVAMSKVILSFVESCFASRMAEKEIRAKLTAMNCDSAQIEKYLKLGKVKEIEATRQLTEKERLTVREVAQFGDFQKKTVKFEESCKAQGLKVHT